MRMKTQRILAALLSLVLLLALAPAGWAEGEGGDDPVQAAATGITSCSVTVDLSATNYNGDIYKAKVMADMYLVAPAVYNSAYDTYDLDFGNGFNTEFKDLKADFQKTIMGADYLNEDGSVNPNYSYNPEYRPDYVSLMDNKVIPFILDTKKTFTVAASGRAEGEATSFQITPVAPGMYVLVPHGQDLTSKADYVKKVVIEATEEGQQDGEKWASMAHSNSKEYLFTPQLIFVPTKDAVDGIITTWNPGEWESDLKVSLKPEQRSRLGSLQIVKTLRGYVAPRKAPFEFRVEAVLDDDTVFSDVITLEFTDNGTKTATLSNIIPVGATVTVTETYSGAYKQIGDVSYKYSFNGTSEDADPHVIDVEKLLCASFENGPGNTPPGSGIVNHIVYHPQNKGDWEASNPADNADPSA